MVTSPRRDFNSCRKRKRYYSRVIRIERHGDVLRLECSTRRTRLFALSVSMYVVRGVLIDCAFPDVGEEVERWIGAGAPLRGAILTHWHEDHAGNADRLARRAIPLAGVRETFDILRAPKPLARYRRFTWGTPAPLGRPVIRFAPDDLAMIPTPGHSADHHAAWDAQEGTLFSGDLFLGTRVSTAHANENPRLLVQSLRAAAALGPERVFDSHRGLLPNAARSLTGKAEWLDEVIGRIDVLAGRGWDARAIRRATIGREPMACYISEGEYSKANFIRAVLDSRPR